MAQGHMKGAPNEKYMNIVISKVLGSDLQRRKFIDIKMNNDNVPCQLETGSDLLIRSENTWKKMIYQNWHLPKKLQEV